MQCSQFAGAPTFGSLILNHCHKTWCIMMYDEAIMQRDSLLLLQRLLMLRNLDICWLSWTCLCT